MRKTLAYFLYTMLVACIVCACNDRLDITQNYDFDLYVMPYFKKIVRNETVEIRCQLVKAGNYAQAKYYIRYFQPDGKGELHLDDGTLLTPNDPVLLTKDIFRLYYTSRCNDQQTVDIYIEDNDNRTVRKTFGFTNDNESPEVP